MYTTSTPPGTSTPRRQRPPPSHRHVRCQHTTEPSSNTYTTPTSTTTPPPCTPPAHRRAHLHHDVNAHHHSTAMYTTRTPPSTPTLRPQRPPPPHRHVQHQHTTEHTYTTMPMPTTTPPPSLAQQNTHQAAEQPLGSSEQAELEERVKEQAYQFAQTLMGSVRVRDKHPPVTCPAWLSTGRPPPPRAHVGGCR